MFIAFSLQYSNLKTTQMFFERSMVKPTLARPYHEILLGNKGTKLLVHSTAWMDLKAFMLNGKSHFSKVT